MKYSIKDIKKSLPEYKAKIEPFWGRLFIRRVSYYVTYLLINTGCSANMVSVFSCFVAMLGSFMMCINNWKCIWLGIILLTFWSVLDCVDGNIARCTKKSSWAGVFFDAMGGYTISAFVMVGAGMAAYNTTVFFENYRVYLLLVGTVAGVCDIFSRLIYQKYSNCIIRMEYARINNWGIKQEGGEGLDKEGDNSFIKKVSFFIDYEFGIGGDETLILIIAALIKKIDFFLVIFDISYSWLCNCFWNVH